MKKQQNCVKYNTIPNGKFIIVSFWIVITILFLIGVILLPGEEAFMVWSIVAILCLVMVMFYSKKYYNVLTFTNEKITLKRRSFLWDEVCITVCCHGPNILRNSFDIYAYFDNHYLTQQEIQSRSVKKKGFYMILNYERTEYTLCRYLKKVEIINISPIDRDGVMNMIAMHNETFS